jgi:hypothetical protein
VIGRRGKGSTLDGDVDGVLNGGVEVAALGALGGPLPVVGRSGESGGGPVICLRRRRVVLVAALVGGRCVWVRAEAGEGREKREGNGSDSLLGP